MARQPRALCVEATRDCRRSDACRQDPRPAGTGASWYINGRGSGEGRILELNKGARKFKRFQDVCDGGSVSMAEDFVTKLTSQGKPRRPRVSGSWCPRRHRQASAVQPAPLVVTAADRPERRAKGFRTASSRRPAIVVRPRASRLQSACRCRSRSRSRSGREEYQGPPLVSC
jgi:hypothetical protein